jgi:hypothetical protein
MTIATDKILSKEEFKKRLSFDELDELENFDALMEAYSQLSALCREQQKAIEDLRPLAICHAARYASALGIELHPVHAEILEQAEELLAAFPETLREKSAPDDGSDEEYSEEEDYLTGK